MELKKYNKKICREAMTGTQWERLLFFCESGMGAQRFVFSPKLDPKAIFNYEKKVPEFTLMGELMVLRFR